MMKTESKSTVHNCRICLQIKNLVLLSLSNEIRDIFHKITNLELAKSEALSNLICNICYKKLIETRNYRDELISNELILRQQLHFEDNVCEDQVKVEIAADYEIVDVIEEEHLEEYYIDPLEVDRVEEIYRIPNMYTKRNVLTPPRKRQIYYEDTDESSTPKKTPRILIQKAPEISLELKKEIAAMPLNAEGKVTCPHCLKTMKRNAYAQHFQRSHLGLKFFMCDLCGKDFYKIWDLRGHMSQHLTEPPIKCPQCDVKVKTRAQLRRHMLYDHDASQDFVCEICARKFKENHKLQRHIRTKHSDHRFQCPYEGCGGEYSAEQYLLQHMNVKHEAKDEPCDVCGKMYRSGLRMYHHKRNQHSEKKFECSYCEEKFATNERKLYHEKIHDGQKSYVCEICNIGYRRKRNLTRHIKVSHRKSRFYCPVRMCSSILCNKDNLRAHIRTVHKSMHAEEMEVMLEEVKQMKPHYFETESDEKLL